MHSKSVQKIQYTTGNKPNVLISNIIMDIKSEFKS